MYNFDVHTQALCSMTIIIGVPTVCYDLLCYLKFSTLVLIFSWLEIMLRMGPTCKISESTILID